MKCKKMEKLLLALLLFLSFLGLVKELYWIR